MSAQPEGSRSIDYLVGLGGLTAIGVFVYAILRFSYWSFYNRFGITPEEVGLGYVEILTRSAPVLVLAMTLAAGFNALLARKLLHLDTGQVWRIAGITSALLLAAVLFAGPVRANDLADLAERGIPVHPRLPVELVAVQVDYVTLTPNGETEEKEQKTQTSVPVAQAPSPSQEDVEALEQRTSLLYFGQSNQIAVLYDTENQQVIRVPMADVTIIAE